MLLFTCAGKKRDGDAVGLGCTSSTKHATMIENERGNERKERRGSKIVISYRGGKNRNVGDV